MIEKAERKLTLLRDGKELIHFSIALGGNPLGAKTCEGDEKTPEGVYRIIGRNTKSSFYKSLRVSYPSNADRKRAAEHKCRPGGDIMIHGLPNGLAYLGATHRLRDWTLGCIAVTNGEIDEIWRLVPDGTEVVIEP